ncbi:MAG: ABC transporter substrate-binding protein [Lautropia sp.]
MRRSLLLRALSIAASGALGLPGVGRAADLTKVRVNIIPLADLAPFYAAMKQGYFKEEGLDIDTTPSTGGAVGIPGLVGGSFDIAYGNVVTTLLAASQGLDVVVISPAAGGYGRASGMVARTADKIRSGADLEGKTVAVNTRNNNIWLFARAWVRKTGGNPDKVTFKEVPFPQMADALKNRQIDAAFHVDPFLTVLREQPDVYEVVGNPYNDVQPGVQIGQYIATRAFVQKNPDVVRRFLAGLRKGNAWYDARLSSPELAELIAGYTRLSPEVTAKLKKGETYKRIEVEEMRTTMQIMREQGLLKKDVDVEALVARLPN